MGNRRGRVRAAAAVAGGKDNSPDGAAVRNWCSTP
jgi:hypothetical protein